VKGLFFMWLKSLEEWKAKGIACALITIIKSQGSTPRGAGAKMAFNCHGDIAGSVGGGICGGTLTVFIEPILAEK
jgi:xanthine/CO dehydrogenase XdhC/CoxF family maturation factor